MKRLAIACIALAQLIGTAAAAQAYCALRDPVDAIREFFPGDISYRSSVETVDQDVRSALLDRLPFTLLPSELGQHTLYAIHEDDRLVGYVHSRSEPGRWGLIEIAWALDPELRLLDFRFQRCRDRGRSELEGPSVREALHGRSFEDVASLLDPETGRPILGALPVGEGASELAGTVIRSALKTIAVTDLVWTTSPDGATTDD